MPRNVFQKKGNWELGVRQGVTNLSNANPKIRFLDVGCGFVVAAEESYRPLLVDSRLSFGTQTSEHMQNSLIGTKAGWIIIGPNEQKVISENIISIVFGKAIVNGDLFCVPVVGDADVDSIVAEVLDGVCGITFIPGNQKGFASGTDPIFDVLVGKC